MKYSRALSIAIDALNDLHIKAIEDGLELYFLTVKDIEDAIEVLEEEQIHADRVGR